MYISKRSRREFLSSIAATPLLQASKRPPNVLLFMTDQESALLPGPVKRPAHDYVRSRGVAFRNAFCNTPQCSPARSSLLTGLAPHRSGVLTNVDKSSLGKPLATKIPTVGNVFRNAGYTTGYFGKWHLGNEETGPESFGFTDRHAGGDSSSAQAAADWIRRQPGPWLAWVSILNPHDIYQVVDKIRSVSPRSGVRPPATTKGDLATKPSPQSRYLNEDQGRAARDYTAEDWIRYRSFYCELVEKADRCFATTLAAVQDLNNTIVAYTSDHGDVLGEHGLPFKGPFLYEPLIRIPLVIAAPSFRPASVRDDFVVSIDLAPTLAGLAGLKWPSPLDPKEIDGEDLSKGDSKRDAVFLEYYAKQRWVEPIRTIRTREWKLNQYSSGESELYDLRSDPTESKNLSKEAKTADIKNKLDKRLSDWWTGMPRTPGSRVS
jgi:arylsulfatase A-like enzyme